MDAGQDPDLFWRSTMRIVQIILDGAATRMEREREQIAWQIWQTATLTGVAFHTPKKLPSFSKFRRNMGLGKPPSEGELVAKMDAWFTSLGTEDLPQ